jgi:AcrR family transcriptional regulator
MATDIRGDLLDAAARLISEEGPGALSTRRVAQAAGTSSMGVYTHFGSMPQLVREIVREGFARLEARLKAVDTGGDPLEVMAAIAAAYRDHAIADPHLYAVMFGSASLGGYSLTTQDMLDGRYTLDRLAAVARRAIDAGMLAGDANLLANRFWAAMHGYVTLELAGYFQPEAGSVHSVLEPMLRALVAGHAAN